MKKCYFIIFCLLLCIGCSNLDNQSEEENISLPRTIKSTYFKTIEGDEKLKILSLDDFKNFKDLVSEMTKIVHRGEIAGILFKANNTEYKLTGYPNAGGCYFRRTFIDIENDSLVSFENGELKEKSIHYLRNELESIMSKPYNFVYKQNKVKSAVIFLHIDDRYDIEMTKVVLKEILDNFNEINKANGEGFYEYFISFNSFPFPRIPPPPPLPN
ncbi:hypothetical protein ACG2LH_15520 [Zhouia sp. PK063]|uniref:hypothetical protein n=1 Tax=Zhouia sp. PK063 TaxID=3373602 RepID=UPI0037979976